MLGGQISTKDSYTRIDELLKFGKGKVQLQRLPQTFARFLLGLCAHEKIQPILVSSEKLRRQVTTQISRRACQENSHRRIAENAYREATEAPAAGDDQSSARGSRASSGRPSING